MLGVSVQKGTSRWVFLVKQKYALKIARGRLREAWYYRRWQEIREGVKDNKAESGKWNASQDVNLCPVLFSDPVGFMVVMPYARPLTDAEFQALELQYILEGSSPFGRVHHGDFKRENYGMLGDRPVKIDYEA